MPPLGSATRLCLAPASACRPRRTLPLAAALLATLLLALPAGAERTQKGNLIVAVEGNISPLQLPRHRPVPVSLQLGGRIATADGSPLPRMKRIRLVIAGRGVLSTAGLPVCPRARLRNASTPLALRRCGAALVGRGRLQADAFIANQKPFAIHADLLAFNGRSGCPSQSGSKQQHDQPSRLETRASPPFAGRLWPSRSRTQGGLERGASKHRNLIPLRSERSAISFSGERMSLPGRGSEGGRVPVVISPPERERRTGDRLVRDPHAADRGRRDAKCHSRPAVLVHAFSANPPLAIVLPFIVRREGRRLQTSLTATVPAALGDLPHLASFELNLFRRYRHRGELRSYLSASCPAPSGFTAGFVTFAKATYAFEDGRRLRVEAVRSCRAG